MPSRSPSGGLSALSSDESQNAPPSFALRRGSAGGSFLLLNQARTACTFCGGDDFTVNSARRRQSGN